MRRERHERNIQNEMRRHRRFEKSEMRQDDERGEETMRREEEGTKLDDMIQERRQMPKRQDERGEEIK